MTDQAIRQYDEDAFLPHIQHLLVDEIREGLHGRVISLCNCSVLLLKGPRRCCEEDGDASACVGSQQLGSWMIDLGQVTGEVTAAFHSVKDFVPARSIGVKRGI